MPKTQNEFAGVVTLRLRKDEKSALATLAEREGATQSDVIRRMLRAEAGLPLPVAAIDRAVVEGYTEQLRKIGVNLNQAVRAMNEGRVGYDADLYRSLTMLVDAVRLQREGLDQLVKPSRRPSTVEE